MNNSRCPMEMTQLVDEYFLENRHRLLDLAAFLDRLDRAADARDPGQDFRIQALRRAITVLSQSGPERTKQIHLVFSDPTDEPRQQLDRKAAWGAYAAEKEVR